VFQNLLRGSKKYFIWYNFDHCFLAFHTKNYQSKTFLQHEKIVKKKPKNQPNIALKNAQ
jgi:hypothetical protein